MTKTRLEAFSDGVIAILITIMVLELKIPEHGSWEALRPLLPVFLAYVLSFVYVAIYWNNHHHLMHLVERIDAKVMWANMHLLFWLSLNPFVTGWMGLNGNAPLPTAVYGGVQLMCGVAWLILQLTLTSLHGPDSKLSKTLSGSFKGPASAVLYIASIPLAFIHPLIADAVFVLVAIIWFVPDRRIEAAVKAE